MAWASMHSVDSIDQAATYLARGLGDTGIPVAGEGAPWVAEFAVAEFAAVLGLSTDSGRLFLGQALELRYRLPRLWARVVRLEVPAWKARRVADRTLGLTLEAAGFVDRHLAPVAHTVRPVVLERLVDEATARHMPETAEQQRQAALDRTGVVVETDQVSFDGTARIWGELDLADALDLEDALAAEAAALKALGSPAGLDARRATPLGNLARGERHLDLDTAALQEPSGTRSSSSTSRAVVLHVHLTDAALTGQWGVGRVEETRSIVTADQIRDWCGTAGRVVVKPVIDLNQAVGVEQYEVPDRIAERVRLRDHACVFPWCSRPAAGCDTDHIVPHSRGGPTHADNLAPLCRRHHRLKTHGAWTYTVLDPGTYLWASPHGHQFLRDHTGTHALTGDP